MSEPPWTPEGVLRELESLHDIVMQSDRLHNGDPNSREVARRLRRMIARLAEPEPK